MPGEDELKNLVDEFLYLVEVGSGSTAANESELELLLDRIALAMRYLVVSAVPGELPAVPVRNVGVLRKVAASRVPNYGHYNRVRPLVAGAEPAKLEVASAIGDIAVIADHLHAVAWLWRNASLELGLYYLETSQRRSWGRPLRALQLYLQSRTDGSAPEDG